MKNPYLTILTPTYNRASLLGRLFDSLKKQSCPNFEWIVVDDGSGDNTQAVLQSFSDDPCRHFPMQFFRKENGGKHTAINYAMPHINGEIVLILDSDDYLTDDAVEIVLGMWKDYRDDQTVCGMSFLKGYAKDQPLADFRQDVLRSDHIRYRINRNITGDCCEVIRADVLKEFPFPEFPGERFLGENYLWVNAGLKYDTIYIRKVLYICEYMEDGLSRSGRAMRMRNPMGGMLTSKLEMNPKICLKQRIKKAILYSCYGFAAGMKPQAIIRSSGYPLLVGCFLPTGWLFYRKWRT